MKDDQSTIVFGKLTLCRENHCLMINGKPQHLRNKLYRLMKYLAERPNRLVYREELINYIWDGNFYIGEKGLTHAICILRTLLKASPDCGVTIETVPKTGYHLRVRDHSRKPIENKPNTVETIDTSVPEWWPKNSVINRSKFNFD